MYISVLYLICCTITVALFVIAGAVPGSCPNIHMCTCCLCAFDFVYRFILLALAAMAQPERRVVGRASQVAKQAAAIAIRLRLPIFTY